MWYKEFEVVDNQVVETDVNFLGITPNLTLTLKLQYRFAMKAILIPFVVALAFSSCIPEDVQSDDLMAVVEAYLVPDHRLRCRLPGRLPLAALTPT